MSHDRSTPLKNKILAAWDMLFILRKFLFKLFQVEMSLLKNYVSGISVIN